MAVKVRYDKKFDVLYVYKSGKKVKHSIFLFENFVIDISFDFKVVGLEIHNASKVLKVSKTQLENIRKAYLGTYLKGIYFGATYRMVLPKGRIESQLIIPKPKFG